MSFFATHLAGFGAGGEIVWTTVFTNALGNNGGAGGNTVRNPIQSLTGGPYNYIRVTFTAATGGMVFANASVGIASGTNTNTTATPTELKFNNGSSGATLGASASIVSDPLPFSFTSANNLIVILDVSSGQFSYGASGGFDANYTGGASYNNSTGGAVNQGAGLVFGVAKVEGGVG